MLRKTVFAALIGLALPAHAFDLNSMSADEKEAFGKAVREYLVKTQKPFSKPLKCFVSARQRQRPQPT